ncbi:MAG TPA: adenosylcobinamide-phosphate synthase CbiB [Acidobacteriaceae bacterium]|nr:adenosylcobinamide-phosphate synthase CbiB [Acidobacteriaceae bacterium]
MTVIAAASLLDWIAGDPEWLPHPVRLIGRSALLAERLLRRPGQSDREELIAGAVLTTGIVAGTYLITYKVISWAHGRGWGTAAEILLGWTCLASRNLADESRAVLNTIHQPPQARQRLARIVGRDTHSLSNTEVCRALIETLAESACDGIVAPLAYMAIGGVPWAMAYKAVNTLDSMIGHADRRYFYFGKAAARLDDAANYLPSRLTALAIVLAAGRDSRSAFRTWMRDRNKHKSPNAGQPESAMAGALRVRLGGENSYDGERVAAPLMGAEFEPPKLPHARRALRIVVTVSLLSSAAAVMIRRRK